MWVAGGQGMGTTRLSNKSKANQVQACSCCGPSLLFFSRIPISFHVPELARWGLRPFLENRFEGQVMAGPKAPRNREVSHVLAGF